MPRWPSIDHVRCFDRSHRSRTRRATQVAERRNGIRVTCDMKVTPGGGASMPSSRAATSGAMCTSAPRCRRCSYGPFAGSSSRRPTTASSARRDVLRQGGAPLAVWPRPSAVYRADMPGMSSQMSVSASERICMIAGEGEALLGAVAARQFDEHAPRIRARTPGGAACYPCHCAPCQGPAR